MADYPFFCFFVFCFSLLWSPHSFVLINDSGSKLGATYVQSNIISNTVFCDSGFQMTSLRPKPKFLHLTNNNVPKAKEQTEFEANTCLQEKTQPVLSAGKRVKTKL